MKKNGQYYYNEETKENVHTKVKDIIKQTGTHNQRLK